MSYYDYMYGLVIMKDNPPFYALIQAAMRKADNTNLEILRQGWPGVWEELQSRYNAPGGKLEGENGGF